MSTLQTLKGFRDFLPKEALKRQYVIDTVKRVFELYGFEPLETPALEYEEVLLGKYGEEGDKLMYRFEDNGKRKVALRYDQTVPTSRVVAQYGSVSSPQIPMPFKRYQIQPVWRAENTQKGRFREFLQCDADIIGTSSPLADAEVIVTAAMCLNRLGFKTFKVLINDRNIFSNLVKRGVVEEKNLATVIRIIDKLKKIGRVGVVKELEETGISTEKATYLLQVVEETKPTSFITDIFDYLKNMGMPNEFYEFSPTLARGLDYYTSVIFEIEIENYTAGSVCGGGRYDKLIGKLSGGSDIPATGFALGFDRILEALTQLNLFPKDLGVTKVLVTLFSKELKEKAVSLVTRLREQGINTEVFFDESKPLEKQLKYANQKGIPYVVIAGPDEAKKQVVILKDMKTREQKTLSLDSLEYELNNLFGESCCRS